MSIEVRGFGRPVRDIHIDGGSLFLLAQGERVWIALKILEDRPVLLAQLRGDGAAGTEFPQIYGGTGQYITLEGRIIVQPSGFPVPALEARSGSLAVDMNGSTHLRVLHKGDAYFQLGSGRASRSLGSGAVHYQEWDVVQVLGEFGLGGRERVILQMGAATLRH